MQAKLLLLAASTALFSSAAALAQNDECTGAIALVNGANGPFSTAGATTSFAWPCAAGGNDLWFSYVATATGSCTIDACGGTYDTALEVFDGSGGCGSLVSLQCNDDSCGLQSRVQFNATVGVTYFVRLGGFNGATGSAPLNVTPPTPPQPNTLTTNFLGNTTVGIPATFFFDLTVNVPLTINQIDVNLADAVNTVGSIDVFTTPNTYVGNDTNPAAWTLQSSAAVTAAGLGQPSPATVAFVLPAGNYGVAIQYNGLTLAYGCCTNTTYSNNELTLNSGASAAGVLGTAICCTPRDWNGTIRYSLGGAGTLAVRQNYGAGCYNRPAAYYENFASGTFDLSGASGTENVYWHIPTGNGGYALIQAASAWFTPTSAAIPLTDDSVSAPQTLPFVFPFPGGTTSSLAIGSNGMVFPTAATTTDFSPTVTEFLTLMPRYCPLWRDMNPATGGTVHFDIDPSGAIAYVTFLAVPNFGAAANVNTFQVAFHSSGLVEYRYGVVNAAGATIVGYTLGGGQADPGSIDLTATLPGGYQMGNGSTPLALNASARPLTGTTLQLALSNIPGATDLGAVLVNFTSIVPGLDLGYLGMPGCEQHIALAGAVTVGFTIGNGQVPFTIPAGTRWLGTNVFLQGACFSPGVNPLGALASNGVRLTVGNL